jgi:hypothetical protein
MGQGREKKRRTKLIPLFSASSERDLKFYFVGIIVGKLEKLIDHFFRKFTFLKGLCFAFELSRTNGKFRHPV